MKKILVLILLGLHTTVNSQGLLTNLQACYSMDCNNGANSAITGPSLDGTLFNISCAPGHAISANTGYAFNGSASSYILLPNSSLLKPQSITVSGWYKTGSITTSQYLVFTKRPTINSNTGNFEAYALGIVYSAQNGTRFVARLQSTNTTGQEVFHPLQIAANTWYHVVFHIDNTVVKLYVNGALASLPNNASLNYDPLKEVILGGTNETQFNAPFVGSMDNVRFYDRDLTTSEVWDLLFNDPNCSSGGQVVPPPGSCCLGNYCSASQIALSGDYQVPMNSFNFNFTTPLNTSSKVNIGRSTCANGQARLNIADDNIGRGISSSCSTPSGNNIAVSGYAWDPNSNAAVTTLGVLGEAVLVNGNTGATSAGVAGFCGAANLALLPVGEQIGVYGNSLSNGGRWAGYFDGDINVNGTPYSSGGGLWSTSDRRFKKDLVPLSNVSDKLMNLKSYTYMFKTDEFKNMNFSKDEQIGLIAQELNEQFPQLVTEKNGYNYVNYTGLIPVLVAGFKEQQTKIEEQQKQIDELKTIVESLAMSAGKSPGNANSLAVTLGDKNTIVLNQNVPNPFAENTVITYNIPIDFGKAEIIFTTNDGIVIKTIGITQKGKGSLNVFANDLSHGVYTYALVVDGVTIDSKKMVKD